MKLTTKQSDMLGKLNSAGYLSWTYTTAQESKALNILTRKNLAEFEHGKWTITEQGKDEAQKYAGWKRRIFGNDQTRH